jgi:predicted metal-dependent phosphoesterase TrpH
MPLFDLHIHSTCSDGSLTPQELIALAVKSRVQTISLTDHDTVEGLAEAYTQAEKHNINLISGIELSASSHSRSIHILGYGLDFKDPNLLKELKDIQLARKIRNKKIIEKLKKSGINIEEENLRQYSPSGQTGRPHFAHILLDRHVVKSHQEAFDMYLGVNGLAYSPRQILEAEKAISIIRKAHGVAVLAHPFTISVPITTLETMIKELVDFGLSGIEIYYPQHSLQFRTQLKKICRKFNLLETAGSDFHDIKRSGTRLGAFHNSQNVPAEIVVKLKEYLTEL